MAKLTSGLLRPVDPAHALDEAALLRYAAANVPGFPGPAPALALTQFGHGQSNPTYCIQASAPGAGTRRYVLRKKPPGAILQSAHAVEREYQVRFRIPFPSPRSYATYSVPIPYAGCP
jgi:acyl-CoA dehydrogenase